MSDKQETFIQINRNGIKYGFHYRYITENNGMVSTFIPAYDIYYSSPSLEEAKKRAGIMVNSFFKFWIQQQGFRAFILQILKLGFKAPNEKALRQLLERSNINAKLNSPNREVPLDFLQSETHVQEGELELAV